MRVTRVAVQPLFGIFDHSIPLQKIEPVTLIHGPNGFGKTVMLRMVAGCLQGKRNAFEHTPFLEFHLEFDDGTARIVRRHMEPGPDIERWREAAQSESLGSRLLPPLRSPLQVFY